MQKNCSIKYNVLFSEYRPALLRSVLPTEHLQVWPYTAASFLCHVKKVCMCNLMFF